MSTGMTEEERGVLTRAPQCSAGGSPSSKQDTRNEREREDLIHKSIQHKIRKESVGEVLRK